MKRHQYRHPNKIKLFGYSSDNLPVYIPPPMPKTGLCIYCEVPLHPGNFTKDHVRPKSRGGKKSPKKPCCYNCNQEKAAMFLNEYLGYLYRQTGLQNEAVLQIKIKNVKKLLASIRF